MIKCVLIINQIRVHRRRLSLISGSYRGGCGPHRRPGGAAGRRAVCGAQLPGTRLLHGWPRGSRPAPAALPGVGHWSRPPGAGDGGGVGGGCFPPSSPVVQKDSAGVSLWKPQAELLGTSPSPGDPGFTKQIPGVMSPQTTAASGETPLASPASSPGGAPRVPGPGRGRCGPHTQGQSHLG